MDQGRRLVLWTDTARDCLDEILGFIAVKSPTGAARVLDAVLAAAESLAELSERGRVVPETHDESIREIFVFRYRLIYQVSSAEVRILALLHGAMDFAGALGRDSSTPE